MGEPGLNQLLAKESIRFGSAGSNPALTANMEKRICENCGKEHDGSYGSGRFCSKRCRAAFTAKMPRKHNRGEIYVCPYCNEHISGRNAMLRHKHEKHRAAMGNGEIWNKGRTKDTDARIAKASWLHKEHIKSGLVKIWCKGRQLPDETKKLISKSMRKAHAEGRAHNIGESRWNNEPSYPEVWFMKVIDNEFDDKNYIREHPFHLFSLDFAWIHKKKCIEIDGEQHQRFADYAERDKRKDIKLQEEGWQVLRLIWKDVYADPKKYIRLANKFIGI